MTTLHVAVVAAAVAALDIPGLTILDLAHMPPALTNRPLPLLGPSSHEPSFLTEWESRRLTTGGNYHNTYTLNWTLYQAAVSVDRTVFTLYPAMVDSAEKVVNAFLALTRVDGCKHIALAGMPAFGPVHDASGLIYHGAVISLRVTEF
jgi:hypothetical protein